MQVKNFLILLSCAALLASCKNGLFGKNKKEKSDVTGWNYNDKNMGGYQVAKSKEQKQVPAWYLYKVVPLPWARQKKM